MAKIGNTVKSLREHNVHSSRNGNIRVKVQSLFLLKEVLAAMTFQISFTPCLEAVFRNNRADKLALKGKITMQNSNFRFVKQCKRISRRLPLMERMSA